MVDAPFLNQMYLPSLKFHNATAGMKAMPPYPKWNVTGYPAGKFHNDTGDSGECPGSPGCPGYIAPTTDTGSKVKKILNTLSDVFDVLGNVTDSLLQGNVTNPTATIPAATKQKGILGMQPVAGAVVVVLLVGTIAGLGYVVWKKSQPAKS